jgi:hypothetical protein
LNLGSARHRSGSAEGQQKPSIGGSAESAKTVSRAAGALLPKATGLAAPNGSKPPYPAASAAALAEA